MKVVAMNEDAPTMLVSPASTSPANDHNIKLIQTNASTKAAEEFRNYNVTETAERVIQHYKDMRTY